MTPKMRDALRIIQELEGALTVRELAAEMDIGSSAAFDVCKRLRSRGHLVWERRAARSFQVLTRVPPPVDFPFELARPLPPFATKVPHEA